MVVIYFKEIIYYHNKNTNNERNIPKTSTNSESVASPSAGRTLISVNESGELFTKDSSGNVIVYPTSSAGGGGGGVL
jgi:hypothetical protein